jgi:uncharacterized protein YukE
MGIYSHLSTEELTAKRARLVDALELRLTGPSRVAFAGNSSEFNHRVSEYQQAIDHLRREINAINAELDRRGASGSLTGSNARAPIYLVG